MRRARRPTISGWRRPVGAGVPITTRPPRDPDLAQSTASERATLLAEAYHDASRREKALAAEGKAPEDRRGRVLAVLLVILAASSVYAGRRMTADVEIGTAERRLRDAQVTAYVAHLGIEAFRSEHGRLPNTMEEAGEDSPAIRYALVGQGYRIEVTIDDAQATYVSGQDLAPFREAFHTLPRRRR